MADIHYTDPSRQSELPEYDEEAAAEYVSSLQPIKDQKRKGKRNKIILIALLLMAAAGATAYFLFFKPDKPEQQAPQTNQPLQTEQEPQVVESETYRSNELNLTFDYPKNWKLDDTTPGLITVSSPVVKLADVNGQQSDGKVVVTILSAGSEVPAFEGGSSATAVQDSEKITYDRPSQSQREQTYVSFAGFGSSGLDAVFITGDAGYQKDQFIPESDIKKIEPIISVKFYGCSDAECAGEGSGQYTISLEEWAGNQMTQAALAMLKSLTIE